MDLLLINCQHFRCDQCKPHVLIQINLKLAAFILGNLNLLLDHRSINNQLANLFSLALKPLFMWSLSFLHVPLVIDEYKCKCGS